jgi:hypothetical protein
MHRTSLGKSDEHDLNRGNDSLKQTFFIVEQKMFHD